MVPLLASPSAYGSLERRLSRRLMTLVVSLLLASGCTDRHRSTSLGEAAPDHGGLTLALLDSVELKETDSLFIGRIGPAFAADSEGRLYVGASSFGKIIRFSRKGQVEAVYGRHGSGPGEFENVYPVIAVIGDLVIGTSSRLYRVNVFDALSGAPLASHRYIGFVTSMQSHHDSLWFGNFSRRDSLSIGAVAIGTLRSSQPQSLKLFQPAFVSLPTEYYTSPELELASEVRLAVSNGKAVVGFAPTNFLLVFDRRTGGIDTIQVPTRHRRGAPADSLARHFGSKFRFDKAVNSISVLEGVWNLTDGRLLLIHYDTEASMDGKRLAALGGRSFASILSPDLRQACVDGPIPTAKDARPFFTVQGDTILVLEQRVIDTPQPGVSTVVKRYGLSAGSCHWIPTR